MVVAYTKKDYVGVRQAGNLCIDYDENQFLLDEVKSCIQPVRTVEVYSMQNIIESRKQVHKILLANLVQYGNIEPPGSFDRAYHAGIKSGYPFSAVNYLRIAAAQRAHVHRDPRWLSAFLIENNRMKVAQDAQPVQIEFWRVGDSAQQPIGELHKFYNVEDIVGFSHESKSIRGDLPQNFKHAIQLLQANQMSVDQDEGVDQIFEQIRHYSKIKGADELAAPLVAQMFLKVCRLSYDYVQHPLYSASQLKKIKRNYRLLYKAVEKAQLVLSGICFNHEPTLKIIAERYKADIAASEFIYKKSVHFWKPFTKLLVDLAWSEYPFKDHAGKLYPNGSHLNGEEAYLFLRKLWSVDQMISANQSAKGNKLHYKVKLFLRYGQYHHGAMCFQLGDLGLGTYESVSKGLQAYFNLYRNQLMENEEQQKQVLALEPNLTAEQLLKECRRENAICKVEFSKMALEEKKYLDIHSEVIGNYVQQKAMCS